MSDLLESTATSGSGWCRAALESWAGSRRVRVDADGCWIWTGATERGGYGKYGGGLAHRRAYEFFVGPIGTGLELDHLCRTPPCVNPSHLEPVTGAENRARKYAAITHCRNGHAFDAETTYVDPLGRRACRICRRAATRRYKARKRSDLMSTDTAEAQSTPLAARPLAVLVPAQGRPGPAPQLRRGAPAAGQHPYVPAPRVEPGPTDGLLWQHMARRRLDGLSP